jgi:glutaredoxin
MQPLTVTIYTTDSCPYCAEMRDYLIDRRLVFDERRIDLATEAAQEVATLVGDQVAPVAVVSQGAMSPAVVVGFDRMRLEGLLRNMS